MNKIFAYLALVFWHRFRIIKSQQEAYDRGLNHDENVHGDAINTWNCRSFWQDEYGFRYRCAELYDEPKIDKLRCCKCGSSDVYIACPDHCLECYNKYELKNEN